MLKSTFMLGLILIALGFALAAYCIFVAGAPPYAVSLFLANAFITIGYFEVAKYRKSRPSSSEPV